MHPRTNLRELRKCEDPASWLVGADADPPPRPRCRVDYGTARAPTASTGVGQPKPRRVPHPRASSAATNRKGPVAANQSSALIRVQIGAAGATAGRLIGPWKVPVRYGYHRNSPTGNRPIRRSAARAAKYPDMPWTPPPGGVAPEQRYMRGLGV